MTVSDLIRELERLAARTPHGRLTDVEIRVDDRPGWEGEGVIETLQLSVKEEEKGYDAPFIKIVIRMW